MFRNYSFDEKDPSNKHSFDIHDVDIAFINGLRRTILTDIPMCGMIGEETPTIQIISSNGPLHNEFLCHRIGLIPVCLNEDQLENYEDNSLELELNMKNDDINMMNVTTEHIKGKWNGKELSQKELSIMFPIDKVSKSHILITRLRTGEQLHFRAQVVKGTARKNASFCPVSLSNFYYLEDPEKSKKEKNVLDKERAYYTNEYGDANVVRFEIEPIYHNIGPKYLINKAIEIIIDKMNNLNKNLSDFQDNETINVQPFQNLKNTYEFNIKNEDDTIGNIIQSYIFNKYIREKKKSTVSYIGYICPHPLKYELIIRMTMEDTENVNEFVRCLQDNCRNIVDYLSEMKKDWNKFMKK